MKLLSKLLVAMFASAVALSAVAQQFPARPVKIVLPYPPGGPTDTFARALSIKLAEKWGQPVVVDTRPGASEMIAAQLVANSRPDGHTILFSTDSALTLNQYLFKEMAYDPVTDLVPVTQLTNTPFAFVVPPDSQAQTLEQFISLAKQSPGKYSFGAGGVLGVTQFAFADLVTSPNVNIDALIVPYSGLGTVLPDLLSSRVDSTFGGIAAVEQFVKAGKLRALAVGGTSRSAALPDVPTFKELGYPDVNAGFFSGLSVAKGTPSDIIQKIASDIREVVSTEEFRAQNIDPFALELIASTPEAFTEFLGQNRIQQQERIRKSGTQPT